MKRSEFLRAAAALGLSALLPRPARALTKELHFVQWSDVHWGSDEDAPAAWREATGSARLGLDGFVAWVDAAFEAASFKPAAPPPEAVRVIITPLAQTLQHREHERRAPHGTRTLRPPRMGRGAQKEGLRWTHPRS